MDKPVSFDVNHNNLKSGVYISRVDPVGDTQLVTLDIRIFSREDIQSGEGFLNIKPSWFEGNFSAYVAGIHSLEHVLATVARSDTMLHTKWQYKTIYVGPGGCLSMFYFLLATPKGAPALYTVNADGTMSSSEEAFSLVMTLFEQVIECLKTNGVPSTDPASCGNPILHSYEAALAIAQHYLDSVSQWEVTYPKED